MACCKRDRALRRVARQYVIEALHECEGCDQALETVTPESVQNQMEAEGVPLAGPDFGRLLGFLLELIATLRELFRQPAMETAEKPAKK